ncbi:MAG: hypothetical protein GF398_13785 [Chitinivibrionales bacterium]|nr:hypothetical protein [Chitinivibrionales bacterium]
MTDSAWLAKKKTTARIWLLVIIAAVTGGIAYLVFRNNSQPGSPGPTAGTEHLSRVYQPSAESSDTDAAQPAEITSDAMQVPENAASASGAATVISSEKPHIELNTISCKLLDNAEMTVHLSLFVFYNDTSSRNELLFKREDMKVMVQNVLGRKKMEDVLIKTLRPELIAEVNNVLRESRVIDIEFSDFRIEKD